MKELKHKVLVIGGGAAGMMAAITAARSGAKAVLFEKNDRLGKKLLITGKGRCNVTNHCSAEEVMRNTPRNGKFLYSAMNALPPEKVIDFFESLGCPLKTERGNRVFPVSDKSASVMDALQKALRQEKVEVLRERVEEILQQDGAVIGVRTDKATHYGRKVILCTGGCSYPLTGSDGQGYTLAEQMGHTLVPVRGSLVPLTEDGDWCAQMQGLALKNVEIRLVNEKNKIVYRDFGELLFTHFGLSGPTVLSASAHMKAGERYTLTIDLKPALDEQKLDQRILRDFEQYQNRDLENALKDLYPKTMILVMIARAGLDPAMKVNSITKQQRRALLELTKCFPVEIAGPRPVEEAIVTAGGIKVKEIDPRTMESKLVRGLHFAGEVMDLDAYTGGFNLQIAWATGYAAGTAAASIEFE
jgi:predicted Rossmann fold flavoprotein